MPEARPADSAGAERYLFVLQVLRLLLGLGAVQPLFWLVSACCWDAFLAISLIYHLSKAVISGDWPERLDQATQNSYSPDMYFFYLCMLLLGKSPVALVIVPMWISALYDAVAHAGRQFSGTCLWQQYGARLQHILSVYKEQILVLSAIAEIAAGFMLLLLLLHQPFQYLITVFVYCGVHLPACCWMPETAPYHKQVWQVAARVVRPLLQIGIVVENFVENVKRSPQWSLTMLTPL